MKNLFYLLLLSFLFSCSEEIEIEKTLPSTPEDLKDHSAEFTKEVIEVTDGVHMAIGFALANAMMVEGEDSNIIIDTTGTVETAREVKEIFNLLTLILFLQLFIHTIMGTMFTGPLYLLKNQTQKYMLIHQQKNTSQE